jgi:hypothetical protein
MLKLFARLGHSANILSNKKYFLQKLFSTIFIKMLKLFAESHVMSLGKKFFKKNYSLPSAN